VRWCAHSMRHSPNNFNQSDYSVNIKWLDGVDRSFAEPTHDYHDSLHENFTVPASASFILLIYTSCGGFS
jgi:hypothetical protein